LHDDQLDAAEVHEVHKEFEAAEVAKSLRDRHWVEAPIKALWAALSPKAGYWFALLPLTSTGNVEFEARPHPRDVLTEDLHSSWNALEERLRGDMLSFTLAGFPADDRLVQMGRHGYRLALAVGLTFLRQLQEKELEPTRAFGKACNEAIRRLLDEFPDVADPNEAVRPPLPADAPVAFWDCSTIWSKTGEEQSSGLDRILASLSDDDRVAFLGQLARPSMEYISGREPISVRGVLEHLAKVDRFASAIQEIAIPQISQMLSLLPDAASSADEDAASLADEKESLVRAIQGTIATLDAELTFKGQPCKIYFLPREEGYPSGGYRLRLKGRRGDALVRASFPSGVGVMPRLMDGTPPQ
jgi:hypothetical protein